MYIYLSSFLILLWLTIREIFVGKFSNKKLRLLLFILFMFSTFVAGSRYGVGADFFSYQRIFLYTNTFSDLSGWIEPGFRAIIIISKSLGVSIQGLYFIFSGIMYAFILIGIKKINHRPALSIYIFFMLFNIGYVFNVTRQGIAMAIFIFLIKDIYENRFKKVLFFSILAGSIHTIGYIIILVYFLRNLKIKKNGYLLLTGVSLVLFFLSPFISTFIVNVLPNTLSNIVLSYSDRFILSVDFIGFLQRFLLISLFLFYFNNLQENSHQYFNMIFTFYFLGYILFSLFSFQGMMATRINMFFKILEVFLLPCLLDLKLQKKEILLLYIFIIIYTLSIFVVELQSPVNYPFRVFWLY